MFPQEKLPNWLKKRAELTPDRIAIEFQGASYTFKDLDTLAAKTAGKLSAIGLKPADTCALMLKNHIDSAVMIHALFYLGVKIVIVNNRLSGSEISFQIKDSQAGWFISEEAFSEKNSEVLSKVQDIVFSVKENIQLQKAEDVKIIEEFNLHDMATLMYTSGTTGNPKGVIQTFGNHWWSAVGSVLNLGLKEDDCWFCAVPLFHISGLSILMKNVIYGMKIVITDKFDPDEANRMIEDKGVSIISVVTAMLNRMLQKVGDGGYPSSFRCMLLGGGPAPLSILEECRDKGIPVYQTYGMTETSSQIVTLSPEYSLKKIGSAGKSLFPSQLRIEAEGRVAAPNEAGEIVVSGPNVTKGYYNREKETEKSIQNGWLYTGDIGYLDVEGFLYVLDRRSDLIISGGENIYPAEIESVLMKHHDVFEAGVTSMNHPQWGSVPAAFVVRHSGKKTSAEELLAYCRQYLASYKVPKRIIFCEELPRSGANKLLRRELKKRLEESD
ncbi:o-succinylbenzoate--CoA ligase [Peribacillus sp. B-H-3]|uniref:o-succinylbenzoate--CoA ligase n=1 Tax=Peribacillus sp. B-H-3 TaxID=3400420 RepID=UPI003B02D196